MSDFKGRHVVVSGGGTGTGAEIARQFSQHGAAVTVLGRREAPLASVADEIGGLAVCCDVTNKDAVDLALDNARQSHGAVSIVVANAGAANSKPFEKMTSNDLGLMIDVNLNGVFNLWQGCLADMKSAGWGRMLAIASSAGLRGYSYVSGYCAAKHAVIGLTRSLSMELATSGITVNSICPGFIETPMLDASIKNIVEKTGMSSEQAADRLKAGNPMNRFIQPDEVAAAALWLCSVGGRSVNGQAISVNGGEL